MSMKKTLNKIRSYLASLARKDLSEPKRSRSGYGKQRTRAARGAYGKPKQFLPPTLETIPTKHLHAAARRRRLAQTP